MLIHTKIPSIFSSNPRFPLVFSFSRHCERFKMQNTTLILIDIRKSGFRNGNYRNTVNLYTPNILEDVDIKTEKTF